MAAKRVQLVSVGSRYQRFAKLCGHFNGSAVQIEKAFMKVTKLDRIKAIHLFEKSFANRAAEHVERMGRNGEDRQSTAGPKLTEIVEIF